jgi:hypothetical protein
VQVSAIPNTGHPINLYRKIGSITNDSYGDYHLVTSLSAGTTSYLDNNETQTYDQFLVSRNDGTGASPPTDKLPSSTQNFLTGVSGLTEPVPAGSDISLFLEVNNLASQADYATRSGGTGIREIPLIVNQALTSYANMLIFGNAQLQVFGSPIKTVVYSTRDFKSKPGKIIDINLTHPPIVATLQIQTAVLDLIRYQPGTPPRYAVTASAIKFTMNDFLRNTVLAP